MKTYKVTNAHYLATIAPRIQQLRDKLDIPSITYEGLFTFFATSIQFGAGNSEFVIVFDEGKPTAFAHWYALGLPHSGRVFCDYVYSWGKKHDALEMLYKEFVEFGKKKRAVYYGGCAINEKTLSIFKKTSEDLGFELNEHKAKMFDMVKKEENNG